MRALFLACALPATLLAAEPDLAVAADLTTLRALVPGTKPTSAWAGADAGKILRERLDQAAAVEPAWPPVMALLDTATALLVERQGPVWAVSAPGASAPWTTWASHLSAAAGAVASTPATPVVWQWHGEPTLARWNAAGLEMPLGGWRGAPFTLQGAWALDAGQWKATTTLTTTAIHPLRTVDPEAIDSACLVGVATAVDPHLVAMTLTRNLHPAHRRFLEERLGMPLGDLAGLLSGEVLIRVDPGELLPAVTCSLGLRPGAGVGEGLLTALADSFRGQGTTLNGASRAVRLDTPVGPWFAAIAAERLVIGSDAIRVGEALGHRVATQGGDVVLVARADLPALARRYLPLALATQPSLPLVRDPLPDLIARVVEVATSQAQAQAPFAAGLVPGAPLSVRAGSATRSFSLAPADLARLTTLLGERPADRVAAYAPTTDEDRVQVVVRTAAGWLVATDVAHGFTKPVTAEAATRRLRDLGTPRLVLGRPLADLDPLTVPPVPRLDRDCVPAIEALAAALVPWQVRVRTLPKGLVVEEQGVPLLNAACLAAIAILPEPPRPPAFTEY